MLLLLLTQPARADQCARVDPETALAARGFLRPGAVWAALCEPCGETVPVRAVVGEVRIRPTSAPPLVSVEVDGRAVDLAYVFVQATPEARRLTNLARLVRCSAHGVSGAVPDPDAPLPAPDLPGPAPCAQRTDPDGDGQWDYVQRFGYGPDRLLARVETDADGDGRVDATVRLTHDPDGHPLQAAHDDDGDGAVDRVLDCRLDRCPTSAAPQCPSDATCEVGLLGLITAVRRGAARTETDYDCWTEGPGGWSYHPPVDRAPTAR